MGKKISKDELKFYLETTFIFACLTIIVSSMALNRACNGITNPQVCFFADQYVIRNIIEHFVTGFYIPFLIIFLYYFFRIFFWNVIQRKEFVFETKEMEMKTILIVCIISLIAEGLFQFDISYNSASLYQYVSGFIGILLGIGYFFHRK